jgi:hypothetical protein
VTPVCATCGAWFADGPAPATCPICEDERQWVPEDGQLWTTAEALASAHRADVREVEPGLIGVGLQPAFGIGQRLLLVDCSAGNIVWDMIPAVTEDAVAAVTARGPVQAIAISHPHYYSAMSGWSEALGNVPILLHAADRDHVTRPCAAVEHWDGETLPLAGGSTLIRLGGHFAGGTVMHWPDGAEGRGALLTGDIVMVVPDRTVVSFMWSYPNLLPLPVREIERIAGALDPWEYDRIHGAWWDRVIRSDARGAVRRGVERYVRALA